MSDHPYKSATDFSIGDRIGVQLRDGTYHVGPLESITITPPPVVPVELPPRPRWWRFRARREWNSLGRWRTDGLTQYSLTIGEAQ